MVSEFSSDSNHLTCSPFLRPSRELLDPSQSVILYSARRHLLDLFGQDYVFTLKCIRLDIHGLERF